VQNSGAPQRLAAECNCRLRFPSEDDWKLFDMVYPIGAETGYAKGFVHATTLIFTAMLAAAAWQAL
jgi:hypothetical protein